MKAGNIFLIKQFKLGQYSILVLACVILCSMYIGMSQRRIYAYEFKDRDEILIDEQLSDQRETQYREPKKILVTQVQSTAQELTYNSEVWVQNLYYYCITRLGFGDIPYNYLLGRDGVIYQGRKGYSGVIPELQNDEGVVLIGYLSNGSDIPPLAQESLSEFITELSKRYAIPQNQVHTVTLAIATDSTQAGNNDSNNAQVSNFSNDENKKLSKVTYKAVNNAFTSNVRAVTAKSTFSTSKSVRSYVGEVTELVYPKENAMASEVTVSMKLVNKSDFPWFTNTDWIYLRTEDKEETEFAVNGVWDSFSTPLHIEDEVILPGENLDVEFLLNMKQPPEKDVTVPFQFFLKKDKRIQGTQFDVVFDIVKGEKELVKIKSAKAGYLNVHDCASIYCDTIAKVNTGEIYVYTDEKRGFYLINYDEEDDSSEGWVYGKYVEKL